MPGADRTGPKGLGPLTGRRAGYCTGAIRTEDITIDRFGFGQGFGRGRRINGGGFGQGYRNRYFGTQTGFNAASEKPFLEYKRQLMEQELEMIKSRLQEIEIPKNEN